MAINYIRQCPVYERKCTSSPGGWQEITQTAFSLLFNALQMSMLICLHFICHGTRHTLDNKPLWLWIDPQIRLQRGCVHAKTHTRLESILFEALYLFEVRVEDGSFLMRYTRREIVGTETMNSLTLGHGLFFSLALIHLHAQPSS